MIGALLRHFPVAGERRSPLASSAFAATGEISVSSSAFADGGAIPKACAGKGVGDDSSPQLSWSGVPAHARQVVLIIDDIDVPLPRPLIHSVAVVDPGVERVDSGALRPETPGFRFLPGTLGHRGYAGPRPIPGHGPHRYRFMVFALDKAIPDDVGTSKALLREMAGHVLARGVLTGTYERG
jgi:phosphatidylethanolamine-binding protein (PEBP) family uncharacterized protein